MTAPQFFAAPVAVERLDCAAGGRAYDALLCSVGYETRSRAIAEHLRPATGRITGVEFAHGHNKVYERNRRTMDDLGTDVQRKNDPEFVAWVPDWLAEVGRSASDAGMHVAVDISSMSRPRIAGVVRALTNVPLGARVTIDFLYAPAAYEPAPTELPDATEALEPVTPAFAGAPADPAEPLVLVFGLGYEPERAASAMDEFAPERAVPFFPIGSDERFVADVKRSNADVLGLREVGSPVCYSIADPFRTLTNLEALVERL